MIGPLICFLLSAAFCAAGFWFYSNSEHTAFDKTFEVINSVKKDFKDLNELVTSNITTIANANLRVKAVEEDNAKMRLEISKMSDELDVFRDQVCDTREKQIKLRDMLSKKRPQISMPTGPIPIEIYMGSGPSPKSPHAKPTTEQKATLKKVKKQLDGLSR